jgi:lysozyme
MNLTRKLIELDEGVRSKRYVDTKGKRTIGIGHNLDAAPACQEVIDIQTKAGLPVDDDWLPESIEAQYVEDLSDNCSWLWNRPWWGACNEPRQAALNDMAFNLGPERMQKFVTFLGLIAVQDWNASANDLINNTEVAKELPVRYYRLARILHSGEMQT